MVNRLANLIETAEKKRINTRAVERKRKKKKKIVSIFRRLRLELITIATRMALGSVLARDYTILFLRAPLINALAKN